AVLVWESSRRPQPCGAAERPPSTSAGWRIPGLCGSCPCAPAVLVISQRQRGCYGTIWALRGSSAAGVTLEQERPGTERGGKSREPGAPAPCAAHPAIGFPSITLIIDEVG